MEKGLDIPLQVTDSFFEICNSAAHPNPSLESDKLRKLEEGIVEAGLCHIVVSPSAELLLVSLVSDCSIAFSRCTACCRAFCSVSPSVP